MTNTLTDLEYISYLNENGLLPTESQGKIGVYAIFDKDKVLQFIGYSRDIYLSLKQHLVRQPNLCYWVKYFTIERPNRSILEDTKNAWIAENGTMPLGNQDAKIWNDPIDTKPMMTLEEKEKFSSLDDLSQMKFLKNMARKIEEKMLTELKLRGVNEEIRFNPKLKDSGLLDLK